MLTDVSQNSVLEKNSVKNWANMINLDSYLTCVICVICNTFFIQTEFHPGMRFTSKQKFFHPTMSFIAGWDFAFIICKQPPKIEVQTDAKNKVHTCSNNSHYSSRYYSSCITCYINDVFSILKQSITQKVISSKMFGKNALFVVPSFWFPCIYRWTL